MKLKATKEELIKMINNNEDVTEIDTSEITDMSWMFEGCHVKIQNQHNPS